MIDDVPDSLIKELIAMHLSTDENLIAVPPPVNVRAELFEKIFPPRKADYLLSQIPTPNSQAIVVADLNGMIEWVSPAFSRMCGYSLQELRGNKAGKMLQGADTDPTALEILRNGVRNRLPAHAQLVNYSKNGGRYNVDIELFPTQESDGSYNGFIAIEKELQAIV